MSDAHVSTPTAVLFYTTKRWEGNHPAFQKVEIGSASLLGVILPPGTICFQVAEANKVEFEIDGVAISHVFNEKHFSQIICVADAYARAFGEHMPSDWIHAQGVWLPDGSLKVVRIIEPSTNASPSTTASVTISA